MQLLLQKEEAACAEVLFVFYQNSKSQEAIFSYFSRDVVEIFKLLHSRVRVWPLLAGGSTESTVENTPHVKAASHMGLKREQQVVSSQQS